jgi:hypothetical protein
MRPGLGWRAFGAIAGRFPHIRGESGLRKGSPLYAAHKKADDGEPSSAISDRLGDRPY